MSYWWLMIAWLIFYVILMIIYYWIIDDDWWSNQLKNACITWDFDHVTLYHIILVMLSCHFISYLIATIYIWFYRNLMQFVLFHILYHKYDLIFDNTICSYLKKRNAKNILYYVKLQMCLLLCAVTLYNHYIIFQ